MELVETGQTWQKPGAWRRGIIKLNNAELNLFFTDAAGIVPTLVGGEYTAGSKLESLVYRLSTNRGRTTKMRKRIAQFDMPYGSSARTGATCIEQQATW